MKVLIRIVVVLLILGGLGAAGVWYWRDQGSSAPTYRTATVERGDLIATIGATGTVEPEEVVDVGAQVAGQILSFGKDKSGKAIDYGSRVEEGTILAQIDDTLYASDAASAQAQLELAQAGVVRSKADLEQMKAKLVQAQRDWDRAQKISSDALAQTTYDSYQAVYETAKANVAVGEAAIKQADASVDQAKAQLKRVRRNLSYCTISSPVKGVIIDRRVNIGQTVVASLNAPSLFLIAKDLKRMQVWVPVNEADIGTIHAGQPVRFRVDAYPGQIFTGEVGKIRLNASMTQNVVTYIVEVVTDNSSGPLLPYLTANVDFQVDQRENVLLVPNVALRWTPAPQRIAPDASSDSPAEQPPATTRPATGRSTTRPGNTNATRGTLWIQDGDFVRPVKVRVGLTDGTMTEIRGDTLTEGAKVVVGEVSAAQAKAASGDVTNPFAPTMPRGGGARGH